MKRKVISLLLAFALPLTSCNFNFCSATGYKYYESGSFSYAQRRDLENEIRRLQDSLNRLEKEKEVKQLQEKLQLLEKNNRNHKKSSFWATTKRNFKNFFSANLGVIGSICAAFGVIVTLAGMCAAGAATYDCYTDNHCHFNDKSFLKKFNKETFKKSFGSLYSFFAEAMKHVNFVVVSSNNDKTEDEE